MASSGSVARVGANSCGAAVPARLDDQRAFSAAGVGLRRLRWSQRKNGLAGWRQRARSRDELATLSDRVLQDIGLSRCTANFEASKPFWMP
ncbi:MAG: DUF1127 domain-containing protein [Xanthobacteraceae bacterium]